MAEVVVEALQKQFGDFIAVHDSSFTVRDGEFFVMLGPSGCGKTTTLRMIAGLELPTGGRVQLGGEDVTWLRPAQRDIAFVFQLFALYPHMNVRKNISFPLRMQRVRRSEIRQRVDEVAQMLRIEHLLDKPVSNLSAGDRQRVALGRAIIRRAKAFLFDEPLGALDAEFRDLMREELRQLHDRIGATSIYVTHDQIEAMSMADRICVMNQGKVLQVDTPMDIYERPKTKFVASFIGSPSMNFLSAKGRIPVGSRQIQVNGTCLEMPRLREALDAEKAEIGIRPEHIRISSKGPLKGRVFAVEYAGASQMVTVDTSAGRLKVRIDNAQRVRENEVVRLLPDPTKIVVFDPHDDHALDSELFEEKHHE